MPFLVVLEGPDAGKRVKLVSGTNFVGRNPNHCILPLTDAKVSGKHAQVTMLSDGTLQVVDCNSTNGTFVNNKKINGEYTLSPGDVLRLGGSSIRLELNPVVGSESESFTRNIRLVKGVIRIGRDPANDIVLDHPMVSRYHARIVSQGGKHTIEDLNSTNGVYLNGKRIKDKAIVTPGSQIQIVGFRYLFDGEMVNERDETAGKVRIEIKNLSKAVKNSPGPGHKLLDSINLAIDPSEFVAILGGSGAGKSTFLRALCGISPATSGDVLINGRSFYEEYDSFMAMIGYVPQEDIVHNDLTIREVLAFSARLRMPDDISKRELGTAVQKVMDEIELTEHQNKLVKYLSGGQRKRVSIGVELLTRPSLFFLDEPTSGLDPGLEKNMMEILRKLANQGRTVILVTHATFNIGLCDKVVFLAGGKLAFYGTPEEALAYFRTKDFVEIYKKITEEKQPSEWAHIYERSLLREKYAKSQPGGTTASRPNYGDTTSTQVRTSSLRQWGILTARYARIFCRDRKNLLLLLLQASVIPALIVIVFIHKAPLFDGSGKDMLVWRKDMSTCVNIVVCSAIWLGAFNSVREIIKEIPIYQRERLVKLRVTPYILSKVAVLSLVCFLQAVLLTGIVTFWLEMPGFWLNLAAVFLLLLSSMMMGLTVSSIVSNTEKALTAMPMLLIPQVVLSGAFMPINDIQSQAFKSIFYLAISKWGYELVGGGICDIDGRVGKIGPALLTGSFLQNWFIISGFFVAFYIITNFAMRRKDGLTK